MNNESIAEIKRNLLELGLVRPEDIIGCSPAEIAEIMQAQGVMRLPTVYRDFLSHMGRWAGLYLGMRDDFFYPLLLRAKADAIYILKGEKAPMQLPDDAFVFFAHDQRYMFYFFHTSHATDDVDYYYYMETDQTFTQHKSLLNFYQRSFNFLVQASK